MLRLGFAVTAGNSISDSACTFIFDTRFVDRTVMFAILSPVLSIPTLLTMRYLSFTYIACFTVFVSKLPFLSPQPGVLEYHAMWSGGVRLLSSVFWNGEFRTSMCTNFCVSVVTLFIQYRVTASFPDQLFTYETMILVMSWYSMRFHNQTLTAELAAILEAKTSRNFEHAADILLACMCDAVVHLSSDFEVRMPSLKLAGLLLKQDAKGMHGTNFLDFVHSPSERERLCDLMNRPCEIAGTFNLHLKDTYCRHVPVQIFHTRCFDQDDQLIHILGVRDIGEEERMPVREEADRLALGKPTLEEDRMTVREESDRPAAPENLFFSNDVRQETITEGSSYSGSSSIGSLVLDDPSNNVAVWIDVGTPDYRIVKSTAGFVRLNMCARGSGLLQVIADKSVFRRAVCEFANFMSECGDERKGRPTHCPHSSIHVELVQNNKQYVIAADVSFSSANENDIDVLKTVDPNVIKDVIQLRFNKLRKKSWNRVPSSAAIERVLNKQKRQRSIERNIEWCTSVRL